LVLKRTVEGVPKGRVDCMGTAQGGNAGEDGAAFDWVKRDFRDSSGAKG